MAKSKIIKELTSSECSLTKALKRLYVILSDLNDIELQNWVKRELTGYENNEKVPSYRVVRCLPIGTYEVVGYGKIFTYTNKPLPMIGFDDDLKNKITHFDLSMSISAICEALEDYKNNKYIGMPIPMELWHSFEHGTNITITSATRTIDENELRRVLSNVESKVLDLLLYLDKKFGNLDELDINSDQYDNKDLSNIAESCKLIVFNNYNIQSLDGSKIKSKNLILGNGEIGNKKTNNTTKNSNIGSGSNQIEKHTDIKTNVDVAINKKEKGTKECWLKKIFNRSNKNKSTKK